MGRGLSEEEATSMIVAGFVEPIVKELPMEYAVEMNRLIELNMVEAGAIGYRAPGESSLDRKRLRHGDNPYND